MRDVPEWQQEPPKPPLLPPGGEARASKPRYSMSRARSCIAARNSRATPKKLARHSRVQGQRGCGARARESAPEDLSHHLGENRFLAVKRQSLPRNVAETELQAYTKHRDLLKEEIQKLARNCGWEPTDRQQADPNSVPTEAQTKKMEERGWKAFNALSSTPP